MNKEELMLKEIEATPDILLKDVTPPEFSIDDKISKSLLDNGFEMPAPEPEPAPEPDIKGDDFYLHRDPGKMEYSKESSSSGEKITYAFSELMAPDAVIDLIGWGMPMLAILVASFLPIDFGENETIKKEMKLEASEKKALEKPLARLLEETNIGTKSPLLAFLAVFAMIFITKMAALAMTEKPEPQAAKKIPLPPNKSKKKSNNNKVKTVEFKPTAAAPVRTLFEPTIK